MERIAVELQGRRTDVNASMLRALAEKGAVGSNTRIWVNGVECMLGDRPDLTQARTPKIQSAAFASAVAASPFDAPAEPPVEPAGYSEPSVALPASGARPATTRPVDYGRDATSDLIRRAEEAVAEAALGPAPTTSSFDEPNSENTVKKALWVTGIVITIGVIIALVIIVCAISADVVVDVPPTDEPETPAAAPDEPNAPAASDVPQGGSDTTPAASDADEDELPEDLGDPEEFEDEDDSDD